jgi:hypothetical protein
MKRTLILVCGLTVLAAGAQLARAQDTLESQLNSRLEKGGALSSSEVKPNEMVAGNVAFSGIAVEVLKTDNLLQLFNPFAPAKYGSADENTLHDPGTGKARGWKLFSIQF